MKLLDLENNNAAAVAKVEEFQAGVAHDGVGVIDQRFHKFKNQNPYFGIVGVEIFGSHFVMFSANDDLVAMTFFWHGPSTYEPMSMKLWQSSARETNSVMDVGSFSGVYSLLAATANPACKVVAVEASRRTYGRLVMNVFTNRLERRIRTICRAASNSVTLETFKRFRGENILGIGDSFLEKDNLTVQSDDERVETIAIDQLLEQEEFSPGLIKIDVEGAENLVLEGMDKTLSEIRPKLLIEVTPGTSEQVHSVLKGYGYGVRMVDEQAMELLEVDGPVRKVINLFAEPSGG